MSTFKELYNSYMLFSYFEGKKLDINLKNPNSQAEVDFIQTGIMSIFDNQKFSFSPGYIDNNEFEAVSEEQYNKYIEQMKTYYTKESGKELSYYIPTYAELSNMLNNDLGDYQTWKMFKKTEVEYIDYQKKITPDEILEPVRPDGVIGEFNQAGSGDCYQLGTCAALSYNEKGATLLKKSIKTTEDGNYIVTLYGAKDKPATYEFTREQLKEAQEKTVRIKNTDNNGKVTYETAKKYPYGDADLVLLDMAVEKYRKSTGYKLPYKNTKAVKGYDDYLSTGHPGMNLQLITGKTGYIESYATPEPLAEGSTSLKTTYTPKPKREALIKARLEKLTNPNVVSSCMFYCADNNWNNFKKYNLYENHVYAIQSVDYKNRVVKIANPHEGKNIIIYIPISEFTKYCQSISFVYLDK